MQPLLLGLRSTELPKLPRQQRCWTLGLDTYTDYCHQKLPDLLRGPNSEVEQRH
jgi:hypothetical protein